MTQNSSKSHPATLRLGDHEIATCVDIGTGYQCTLAAVPHPSPTHNYIYDTLIDCAIVWLALVIIFLIVLWRVGACRRRIERTLPVWVKIIK
jgi:hypothetical protein